MNWTLHQLKLFAAVARTGSMTAAADDAGYTIGAVSQQMKALQQEVGSALFIKDGRGVTLSDAGIKLLKHVGPLLTAEQDAVRSVDDDSKGSESVVTLGIFATVGAIACKPLIDALRVTDPDLEVIFHEIDVERDAEYVRSGAVDVALTVEYSQLPDMVGRDLERVVLHTEPMLLAGNDHAGLHPGMDLTRERTWILPPAETAFGSAARQACLSQGAQLDDVHSITDTALVLALVEAGVGMSITTPLMQIVHPLRLQTLALASGSSRSLVTLAKASHMQRRSVRRVVETLETILNGSLMETRQPDEAPR
ncbi:LysR family transcriptional regulator [Arthrobacter rhombi]|uniref:LysR-family transcriptional regulator n=1 Tax=Arthrobacter rhombi TaxID=71253 RepID=A0A1R4FFH9_9MICC|nr:MULTISPECIES: LysR family transcriptional regulator [Micrococcaceae]PCC24745.1 LysR family transcriptional regulator [Glutamicibacter sp. BW78]SJM54750.1 LysR-family transcriptional regulator [Arthrobacter rhombi]